MKIGLLFGSFNPIHHGHLIIANHILNYADITRIWFVVTPHNPLKETRSLLNENHRKHLVDLAVQDDWRMTSSDIEFKLPRPSYTVDTLLHLDERYPDHEFTLIIGSDSYQNLHKWKNHQVLVENYRILVYVRPEFPVEATQTPDSVEIIHNAPLLQISSTYIRRLIKERKSIQYLVPEIVREEILNQQYYF